MIRNKKSKTTYILILLLLGITLGYAYLNTTLNINGTTNISSANWNIYWDNIVFGSNNVTDVNTPATIQTGLTEVVFNVNFSQPGDTYEFTVDAVNDGSIDAMISLVSNGVYAANGTTPKALPAYLEYSVTYENGTAIAQNHLLEAGDTETYRVKVHYKEDITSSQLPSTNDNYVFKFGVAYVQANESAISPTPAAKIMIGDTDLSMVSNLSTLYGQTTNYQSVEGVDWQLFYDDEDYIYLISSTEVPLSTLPSELITSENEWYTTVQFSNIILQNSRWDLGEKSVVFTENPLTSRYLKWVDPDRDIGDRTEKTADITAYMMDIEVWEDFAGNIDGAFAMGGPTVEMFALSYNSKHNLKMGTYETIDSNNTNDFGYLLKLGDGSWESSIYSLDGTYGDMWCSCATTYGYWIASPSSNVDDLLYYDCERFLIPNSIESTGIGIRPLIAIPKSGL